MEAANAGKPTEGLCLKWNEGMLDIDIDLRSGDNKRIADACRMATLLLTAAGKGRLLSENEARVALKCDDNGMGFALYGKDGAPTVVGENWQALAEIYEAEA